MALQYMLETLEGVDETTQKLYVEKDGKFYLDVDLKTVTAHVKPVGQRDMIPISRLNEEITKRKEAETALSEISDQMVESVPEAKRDLIPDLAPSAKINWISTANEKGLFADPKAEPLDTKKPGDKKPADFKDMNPQAIMATGYTTKA